MEGTPVDRMMDRTDTLLNRMVDRIDTQVSRLVGGRSRARKPTAPVNRDVGQLDISIDIAGRGGLTIVHVKGYWYVFMDQACIEDAASRARFLIRQWCKDRVVPLGGGVYMPIHRVNQFNVGEVSSHVVTARTDP